MAQYQHDKAWQIEEHGSFVHFRSTLSPRTTEIYANKFTEDEQGSTDIDDVLRQRRVTPSVIVHRGHSTYVAQTIEKVPATAALVYLGNCGGYALLDTILKKAPKAHILTTKGIGTLTINDPLLKALNDYIFRSKDMTWQIPRHQGLSSSRRSNASTRVSKNRSTARAFSNPPHWRPVHHPTRSPATRSSREACRSSSGTYKAG